MPRRNWAAWPARAAVNAGIVAPAMKTCGHARRSPGINIPHKCARLQSQNCGQGGTSKALGARALIVGQGHWRITVPLGIPYVIYPATASVGSSWQGVASERKGGRFDFCAFLLYGSEMNPAAGAIS